MLICFTVPFSSAVSRNTNIVNQAETCQNTLWSSQPADPNKQPTSSLPVKNNTWNTSHKYFSLHIYPGRRPGRCYSSHRETGNISGALKLYLGISTTLLTDVSGNPHSTLCCPQGQMLPITGLPPRWLRDNSGTRVYHFIFWWSLIQHWERR